MSEKMQRESGFHSQSQTTICMCVAFESDSKACCIVICCRTSYVLTTSIARHCSLHSVLLGAHISGTFSWFVAISRISNFNTAILIWVLIIQPNFKARLGLATEVSSAQSSRMGSFLQARVHKLIISENVTGVVLEI